MDVVRRYIALAEEKTEEARQESHQTVVDVDDLEMPDTPERYGQHYISSDLHVWLYSKYNSKFISVLQNGSISGYFFDFIVHCYSDFIFSSQKTLILKLMC